MKPTIRGITQLLQAMALSTSAIAASAGIAHADGDTLRFAPGSFPVSLDVQRYPAEEGSQVLAQQLFETLVTLKDGEIKPLLAKSWSNPDALTWVFELNENATFSDGSPLMASDVKLSIERLVGLGNAYAPLFASFTEMTADGRSFTIKTDVPLGTMLNTLSLVFIGKGEGVASEEYWQNPIGTGPFVVSDYVADDRVILSRNDNYWGGEGAKLATVEMLNMPEVSSKVTGLITGELDIMTNVPPDQVGSVDGVDGIEYMTGPSYRYMLLWMNEQNEALADPRVRRAMWHAIDMRQIVSDLYGEGVLASAPIASSVFGAPELEQPAYDPELARSLLAEAGYGDGLSLTFKWPREAAPNIRALAQVFASEWQAVGIDVELREQERAAWLEEFIALDYAVTMFDNATPTGDADYTLNRLYTCAVAEKRTGYCNPELDALLAEAVRTLDQDKRKELYAAASRILWDDAVGIWSTEIPNTAAARENVRGFELVANGRPDLSQVYFSE